MAIFGLILLFLIFAYLLFNRELDSFVQVVLGIILLVFLAWFLIVIVNLIWGR